LKDKGAIGETYEGLLAVRVASDEAEALVKAENADRLAIYKKIAEKQNVKWQLVGSRRYLQLAEQSEKGDWLLVKEGTWSQKN
jgi:uncharacterized protein YdbL (DUF1318 family)